MTIGSAFRAVAEVVDEFEAAGFDVVDARSADSDDGVTVEFAVSVPALEQADETNEVSLSVEDASVDDDGRVVFDLAASIPADQPESNGDAKLETGAGSDRDAESTADPDGASDSSSDRENAAVQSDTRADAPSARAVNEESESAADRTDDADGTPPHRDPEKLRAVYGEHDTFADMTEALDADVTPQTVRRQMIAHGIHEPSSPGEEEDDDDGSDVEGDDDSDLAKNGDDRYEVEETGERQSPEADGGRDDAETAIPDGVDLPGETSLDELKRAVQSSRTVYEVAQSLGIDRDRTRHLLDELDLLDLVTGRIAEERRVSPEEVDRRVERASPGSA